MGSHTVAAVWQNLWKQHQAIKNMLLFAVTGDGQSFKSGKTQKIEKQKDGSDPPNFYTRRQLIGLILGPLLFLITLLFISPEGMPKEAQAVLASTLWIATWWITEAIPIPATSLLPIILFPITGALDSKTTTSSYGDDTIFLFMGGFIIALAMERWHLHKRIALTIISLIGTSTERIILGFMVATGFLSMWISNTATAMMMVPIGLAIIYQVKESLASEGIDVSQENFNFGKALMLGIAYSASIGGLGTLIGTPPNAIFAGVAKELYGVTISFAGWMLFGAPLAAVLLILVWVYLVKIAFPMNFKKIPGGKEVIQREKQSLGVMSYEEKAVLTVFVLTALAWISRTFVLEKFITINDTGIAIIAAVVLFIIPSVNKKGGYLMNWDTAKELPWGILLLFGGGLAIAAGFSQSGLAEWIGKQLTVVSGIHFLWVIVIVTTLVIFLTEITSNTATATMMYPIMASLALAINVHPYSLMIAAGIAASCAFMLPVATPPNAVVFGSGYIKIGDMAKAGFWINIFSIVVITLAIYFLLPNVFNIDLSIFPESMK
ncbi:anion transporter [Pueribacillus theae]|uniref:Sodium-dependent dicarboxylate transporter SdcS n=1 Tax=Pueribacillus theae TaxID=2171751 RepID=A0A2U1JV39_9BACI|nr:DASS family sodium-coupled anion symporter [Pueribacillus theae]PWA09066.1 anion transporter [Pueribacillus theae]